jgi:hypothetical protein
MEEITKKCNKCLEVKKLDLFYKHKKVCKICHNKISKEYRLLNIDKVKEISHKNYLKDKEKRREPRRIYAREKRKTDPLFSMRSRISSMFRSSLLKIGYSKRLLSEEILGCTFAEFKLYLESKFESWMNWENRGKYNGNFNTGWDIDHIVPLSTAINEEDILKLNHYTNLQPLCSKINRDIKKDKVE